MSDHFDIKICGIKDAPTLDFAIEQGASMVGFVHFAKSPRHVDLETISALIKQTSGKASSVVLLVNPNWDLVQTIAALKPDFIQLHGSESPEFIARIKGELGQNVIKALPVGNAEDLAAIPTFAGSGVKILLDAKPPEGATRPGGLGEVFDWTILDQLDPKVEFILAAGLTAQNVALAIKSTNAKGVDVSSGVESAPGTKDFAKIKQFIANATTALAS